MEAINFEDVSTQTEFLLSSYVLFSTSLSCCENQFFMGKMNATGGRNWVKSDLIYFIFSM
jgi:hypothetical protein